MKNTLVNETKDLTRDMLSSGLLVVHDTSRSGQNNITELSSWQQVLSPLLDITDLDVESWGNDATLVQSTVQLDNDLTRSVVVNVLELTNVTVSLHNLQELDDDLGGRSDHNLALTALLGVVNALQRISQYRSSGHLRFVFNCTSVSGELELQRLSNRGPE